MAVLLTAVNLLFVGFAVVESRTEEKRPWEWRSLNPFRSFFLLLQSRLALGVGNRLSPYLAPDAVLKHLPKQLLPIS